MTEAKMNFRSGCPICSSLDIIGDKWTLIIIRDMLFFGKKTFKEFSESDESIATNILSSRLKMLEDYKIIVKEKLPENKKTNIYLLTEKGIQLTPMIIEMIHWGNEQIAEFHSSLIDYRETFLKGNKQKIITKVQKLYREQVAAL